MTRPVLPVVTLLLLHPSMGVAQGPPPFELDDPGSGSLSVAIRPSVEQDDGTHEIQLFPTAYAGEERGLSGAGAGERFVSLFPGSLSFVLLAGTPNEYASAPLPEGYGTRSFVLYEEPVVPSGPLAPFQLVGEHFFDAQCNTATCGYLEGALECSSRSTFDVQDGTVAARVRAATSDFGRRYYDAAPGGGDIHEHAVVATSAVQIQDWVYVTGAGATATLVVEASIAADLDVPPVPVDDEGWTTPVYGDIRGFDPCTDEILTSNELLRPTGRRSNGFSFSMQVSSGYHLDEGAWESSVADSDRLDVERSAELVWQDGEEGCGDDLPAVVAGSDGAPVSTLSVELEVPTNEWALVRASAEADASCTGPFACALDVSIPAQLEVTSPNATLVAWHGIAGLTRVPEPGGTLPVATALGALARLRRPRIG
jgi:hypothetical protein